MQEGVQYMDMGKHDDPEEGLGHVSELCGDLLNTGAPALRDR